MELTGVAFTGFGETRMPCGSLHSKGAIPGTLDTHVFSLGVPKPPPAAISNNGNYNDLRLKQGNSGLEADCNEVVRWREEGPRWEEAGWGTFRPLNCFV